MTCPDEGSIAAYVGGRLDEEDARALDEHVDACEPCRELVAMLAGPDRTEPERPERLGRYIVTGQLGEGGMGVVLSAYDPKLDRGVALKLVRPRAFGLDRESSQSRLLAEARALAQLSHPNVVAVHDVGTVDDQVFLAMERVDGPTLRRWLEQDPRTWSQIRDVFVQAGRGLSAAHAAGLVHRDVKLDNVIIGSDERVRVTDFGLARTEAVKATEPASSAGSETLTQTGALLGTPAYMAPELHDGAQADARSDQYSFCVALHEALFGYRPGADTKPPTNRRVPRWLVGVVQRGLSRDPVQRYSSMTSLLEALGRDRRQRRVRAGVAVLFLVAAPMVGTYWWSQQNLCTGAGTEMAKVWNDASRSRLEAAFAKLDDPVVTGLLPRVTGALDGYSVRWTTQHTAACVATRVRGEQSEDLMDRQMSCLQVRRRELGQLIELLAAADQKLALRATRAIDELPGIAGCSRTDLLEARAPEPVDPVARAKLDEVRDRLAVGEALRSAGRDPEAMPVATEAVSLAAQAKWAPIEASALLLLGRVETKLSEFSRAEDTFYEALWAAQRGDDAMQVARAWNNLLWVVAYHQGEYERTDRLAAHARAALQRAGGDRGLEAELEEHVGVLRWQQGRHAEALEHHQNALRIRTEDHGEDHPDVSRSLQNLGIVRKAQGEYAEAAQLHRRALEINVQTLGPDHPSMGMAWNGLGTALFSAGKVEEALHAHRESHRILVARYGKKHAYVAVALNNVGTELMELGQLDAAQAAFEEVHAINLEALGPEHSRVGTPLANLGDLALKRGQPREAVAFWQRATSIWEAAHGEKHPRVVIGLIGVGRSHLDAGANGMALIVLERAHRLAGEIETDDIMRADAAFHLARARRISGRAGWSELALAAQQLYGEDSARAELDAWLKENTSRK